MEIYKVYVFESAHRLPKVPAGHKCGRLHGHSFKMTVYVEGDVGGSSGWVMDYAEISAIVKPVYDQLDHRYLNEIEGLDNPTSEVLAKWIWRKIRPELPQLTKVVINETCTSGCVYRGEDE